MGRSLVLAKPVKEKTPAGGTGVFGGSAIEQGEMRSIA
jgi:hypothetical protein